MASSKQKQPSLPPLSITPYEILGVNETDSISRINTAYRQLVLLVHPDKHGTVSSSKMNMSAEDKNTMYRNITEAYKKILDTRKGAEFPDYNIDYFIDEFLKQDVDKNIGIVDVAHVADFSLDSGETIKKFNTAFDKELIRNAKDGFADPYARGYKEFGRDDETAALIKAGGSRPEINVTTPKTFAKPKYDDNGRLVEYAPKTHFLNVGGNRQNVQELGIAHISDFSFQFGAKSKLGGSDLASAYGENKEYLEDSFNRDAAMKAKFNDTTDIHKKAMARMNDRESIYKEAPDPKIKARFIEEERAAKEAEMLRVMHMRRKSEYLSGSRIGNI